MEFVAAPRLAVLATMGILAIVAVLFIFWQNYKKEYLVNEPMQSLIAAQLEDMRRSEGK